MNICESVGVCSILLAECGISGASITALSGCFGGSGDDAGFDLSVELVGTDLRAAFSQDRSALSPQQIEIVDELLANETAVGYGRRRFRERTVDGIILHIDDSYYRLSVTETGSETIRRDVLDAKRTDERNATSDPVSLNQYDDAAYEIVQPVVATAHRGRMEPHVFYTNAGRPAQLTPNPQHRYINFHDDVYQLTITEQAVDASRFEYTWSELPTATMTIEEAIHDQYHITDIAALELSAEAQTVLQDAIDDSPYAGTVPYAPGEEELVDALEAERAVRGTDPQWLFFRDRYYQATIDWWHGD